MAESDRLLTPWNQTDLAALLTLDEVAPGRYRNRFGDANMNHRAYGGQLLGQALMAASLSAPQGRPATMMQFLFLQGAVPEEPIEFAVTALQDGKRFSSRHVLGTQRGGTTTVLDAHVTFAMPLEAPEHALASAAPEQAPSALPLVHGVQPPWADQLSRLGGFALTDKPSLEFRIPDLEHQVSPATAQTSFRYWIKARAQLPADPAVHVAAYAYLSDWWLNFSSLGIHAQELGPERKLYLSSLNHSIWFHRPFLADEWLHVQSESPCATAGRGLCMARIHDRDGRLVASATQEILMAYARPAAGT